MRLHENKELFKNAIDFIVQNNGFSIDIVIKDYYVTLALKILYKKFEDIVFVGGTSLSKCFNIINRFSEDVDLVAIGNTRSEKQKKTQKVLNFFIKNWPYNVKEDGRRVASDFKPLFLKYPNEYPNVLSNQVRIELITFINPFPTIKIEIRALVGEILNDNEIEEYEMNPFIVKTQEPHRTLIEKILLQKEIYKDYTNRKDSPETAQNRARDFYDIQKIWEYYNGNPPLNVNNTREFINSRRSNRKGKTCISIDEFHEFSLHKQFDVQNISKHLNKDKSKLSIRDLNIDKIKTTLIKIDQYFKKII